MRILICLGFVSLVSGAGTLFAQTASSAKLDSTSTTVRESAVELAFRDFERTGHARVIMPEQDGGFILFPFGHKRPTMRCPRLNACLIALEPGESLTDEPLSGDTERWIIDTSVMGSSAQSPLVVIKPQDCDIATNLLIPTDRRIYELALVADACENGETGGYTRQVKFWYPDQILAEREAERERAASEAAVTVVANRDYSIDRGWFLKRKRYPWIPADVFDDGTRTYVVLPPEAHNGELPVLYLLEGGERHVLNYALRGDTIVADRVLHKAVLVVRTGDDERTIEIENRAPVKREEGKQ